MLTLYYFLGVIALVFIYFSTIFLFAQKLKNNSIVDIFWGLGFVLIAIYSLLFTLFTGFNGGLDIYKIVSAGLIMLWGLRLFLFIGIRNFGKPEDFRYVNMRKNGEPINLLYKRSLRYLCCKVSLPYLLPHRFIWRCSTPKHQIY